MEFSDTLWEHGPRFFYDDTLFRPSTDSFLLGSFATPRKNDTVCDLGGGTGLLGLLLLARFPAIRLHHVELQPPAVSLAEKTFSENGFTAQVTYHLGDLRDKNHLPPVGSCQYVLSNPPYYPPQSGFVAQNPALQIARSETDCTLLEVCQAAAHVLQWGGRFAMCGKPERAVDILATLRQCGLEPKRLQWVQLRADRSPSLLLVEGRRGGKVGLTVLPPFLLQYADGTPTAEYQAAYFRTSADFTR